MKFRLGAIAVLLAALFAGKSFAVDPSGTWRWEHQDPGTQKTVKDILKIKYEKGKVSGTYQGGDDIHDIEKAQVKGNTLSWEFNLDIEGNTLNIAFTGEISADDIQGTVTLGDLGEFPWTAKRDERSAAGSDPEPESESEQPTIADQLRELNVPDVVAKSVAEWSNLPPHIRVAIELLLQGEIKKLEDAKTEDAKNEKKE